MKDDLVNYLKLDGVKDVQLKVGDKVVAAINRTLLCARSLVRHGSTGIGAQKRQCLGVDEGYRSQNCLLLLHHL